MMVPDSEKSLVLTVIECHQGLFSSKCRLMTLLYKPPFRAEKIFLLYIEKLQSDKRSYNRFEISIPALVYAGDGYIEVICDVKEGNSSPKGELLQRMSASTE